MKVLIIGAGRMGMRHALGTATVSQIHEVALADISVTAIENAKKQIKNIPVAGKFSYHLLDEIDGLTGFEIGIVSATASDRIGLCQKVVQSGCKFILIEKPLGQSMTEVHELITFFRKSDVKVFVNLNMRIYPDSLKLKSDLDNLPQFQGNKRITINTGSVGIGANGIHYLDYMFFLTNADSAKLLSAEIDTSTIPSARGQQFKDFGGWCVISLSKENVEVAKVFISVNPESTVFGGWDIIGPHGRITINECSCKRVDYLRNTDSLMPIQRYNADYEQPVETIFNSPMLGDLTRLWIEGLIKDEYLLPSLEEALSAHILMFEWLQYSKEFQDSFPIT
jgi:predicted dehydrogenase